MKLNSVYYDDKINYKEAFIQGLKFQPYIPIIDKFACEDPAQSWQEFIITEVTSLTVNVLLAIGAYKGVKRAYKKLKAK